MDLSKKKKTFKIDVKEFCARHFDDTLWKPRGKKANQKRSKVEYTFYECVAILSDVIECFKKEDLPVEIDAPCTVIGDLNGRYKNLIRLLNIKQIKKQPPISEGQFQTQRTVFLGNYLNLEGESVQFMFLLFSLKVLFPDQYILLRGSYEYAISTNKQFKNELIELFDVTKGTIIFHFFEEAFFHMPLCAIIGQAILCVHSGISPFLKSHTDLKMLPRRISKISKVSLARDMIWGCPLDFETVHMVMEGPYFSRNIANASSYSFNEEAVKECVAKLKIQMIVRSHQCYHRGYRFFADHKMLTIFSTPNFKNTDNKAAILQVHQDGGFSIDRISVRSKYPAETGLSTIATVFDDIASNMDDIEADEDEKKDFLNIT